MCVCNTMEQFTPTIHTPVYAISVATLHNDLSVHAAALFIRYFNCIDRINFLIYRTYDLSVLDMLTDGQKSRLRLPVRHTTGGFAARGKWGGNWAGHTELKNGRAWAERRGRGYTCNWRYE
jgi:hypothetical protein